MLTFKRLREQNIKTTKEIFPSSLEWTISDWMLALTGEIGELANLLKKRNRGEEISDEAIREEIGDIQLYLDKVSYKLGMELDECTIDKFNKVCKKRNCDIKL